MQGETPPADWKPIEELRRRWFADVEAIRGASSLRTWMYSPQKRQDGLAFALA